MKFIRSCMTVLRHPLVIVALLLITAFILGMTYEINEWNKWLLEQMK